MTAENPPSRPSIDRKALIDVGEVATLLGCSTRHVRRLADGGRMPAPIKLGSLVRWRRDEIEAWIADGCKPQQAGRS